jgi:O-antigen ligase
VTAFVAVSALAFDDGGYFPDSWGLAAAVFSCLAGIAILATGRVELGRLELVSLGFLAAFAGWTTVSAAWSENPGSSRLEAERALVYATALPAFLVVSRRRAAGALAAGALAASVLVSSYALILRLVEPARRDPFEGTLLFEPLGYANALGILVAMGALLATGFALRSGRPATRLLAAGALAPLLPTLALTGSRGAWLSAVCGLVVGGALSWRRLPGRRATGSLRLTVLTVLVIVLAIAGVAAAVAAAGTGGDRPEYWRAALRDARAAPALGSGAGTFADYWLEHRTIDRNVQDAHSLYLETLAELGPVGLVLLAGALTVPFVAAFRSRAAPHAPAAAAAFAAFAVHAGVDWDWEMPAVTVAALACAASLLAAARPEELPGASSRLGVTAFAVALVGMGLGFAVVATEGLP